MKNGKIKKDGPLYRFYEVERSFVVLLQSIITLSARAEHRIHIQHEFSWYSIESQYE
jgi:hypothetical protein